ncbi:pentapeptide repeat-containing protein [Metabacillus sp. 84]|uniref:pentapeptide repeat-containing protein n=1 Tax=Metabacillus sp. 84 TaxID=3404705 RepID=UPI003CEB0D9F
MDEQLKADCESCFGLCCVALPYAASADFPIDKPGGIPCHHLKEDYRCGIHQNLREKQFRGCAVYECFGAGQKVSSVTYGGKSWREDTALMEEMFAVFPVMQQLHEILNYVEEAMQRREAEPLYLDLQRVIRKIEELTFLPPKDLLAADVEALRAEANLSLIKTSQLVRGKGRQTKRRYEGLGAKLKGAALSGTDYRGALLIAADLRDADLRKIDWIGADIRDADLSGANLSGSIFLTQAQVNSAKGDVNTKLPEHLQKPDHWKNKVKNHTR